MLPKDSAYGAWPRSGESKSTILPFILSLTHLSLTGEIDIVESRGNSIRYTGQGSNYVQGSLNWGPSPSLNSVSKTYSWWTDKRHSFGSDFHTYALEWTEKFIRIYVDSRLQTLLEIRFDKQSFFERGAYPDVIFNGSSIEPLKNPWAGGNNASPFDKGGLGCFFLLFYSYLRTILLLEFYLILNVAVGGTSGWFPEGQGDKPWLNKAESELPIFFLYSSLTLFFLYLDPMRDFAKVTPKWYTTWPSNVNDRAMVV